MLVRRVVGEEERYLVGEAVPLIRAAAVVAEPDFNGEERDDRNPLAEASVLVLIEEKPGTVLMGEQVAGGFEVTTDLYGKLELYTFSEDLGEAGGVIAMEDLSSKVPPDSTGDVLAESPVRPLSETGSGALLPGEDRRVGEAWTGYWAP